VRKKSQPKVDSGKKRSIKNYRVKGGGKPREAKTKGTVAPKTTEKKQGKTGPIEEDGGKRGVGFNG